MDATLLVYLLVAVVLLGLAAAEFLRLRKAGRRDGLRATFALVKPSPDEQRTVADCVDLLARRSVGFATLQAYAAPDLRTVVMVAQAAEEKLRGEELRDIAEELIQETTESSEALEAGVRTGDPEGVYDALAEYTQFVIRRGSRYPIQPGGADAQVRKFAELLNLCIKQIDRGEFHAARVEMRKWYNSWRNIGTPRQMVDRPLPTHLMPLALLCHEAVLSTYGDSLEWISARYVNATKRRSLKLLNWALSQLNNEGRTSLDERAFFGAKGIHDIQPYRTVTSLINR